MQTYDWSTVPLEQLSPQAARKVIHTGRMTVARLWLKAGAVVPEHHHENEQITMLAKGRLLFYMEGGVHTVNAGQVMVIPPNVPHRVEAIEDSEATDLFSPVREDWRRGDDAYLRGGGSK
ncbi:MAG: cupin domain-containing protein [Acidobacteria bacterium]|nr:cupin domain-containing protein [Acidobacteriota bacterium]